MTELFTDAATGAAPQILIATGDTVDISRTLITEGAALLMATCGREVALEILAGWLARLMAETP